MISLVYGAKGSGKTKKIIDSANDALQTVKGNIVYITDNAKHSKEIRPQIRFIDTAAYGICGAESMMGFIKGVLSSDNDLEKIFIDGFARICNSDINDLKTQFDEIERLSDTDKADFILTISCDELPAYLKKYI